MSERGNYWVFGCSKTIGRAIVEALAAEHDVTGFSRSGFSDSIRNISVDFSDRVATRAAITREIGRSMPDGVVFCQRFRATTDDADLDLLKVGIEVELGPVLTLMEEVARLQSQKTLSVVLLSSVAGTHAQPDLPLWYQMLKSLTVSSVKSLAARHASEHIRINCIVIGEFEKYNRSEYSATESAKFETIERFTLAGRLCSVSDIINSFLFLLSSQSSFISGQIINLDGNFTGIAQEAIVRRLVNEKYI